MNIPNILTLFRICLVPLFVIFLVYGYHLYALITFVTAGVTDALDGMIARFFNQRTELGAYLDPIADKLLLVTAYISLAAIGLIPPWLSIIVISRDIVILTGIAVLFFNDTQPEISPTVLGKLSTFLQIATVILALFEDIHPGFQAAFLNPAVLLTGFIAVASGVQYVHIGIKQGTSSMADK